MPTRKHLFEAKRKDNGKWVKGYYAPRPNLPGGCKHYIVTVGSYKWIEIDPETIRECTGVPDKNGDEIFEGDIIKTKKYGKVVGFANCNDYDIFEVKYASAVFKLVNKGREFNLVGNGTDYEIIGNIYDNPELLEVKA